jgi:toxin-antitoxin system PIN domain toxin
MPRYLKSFLFPDVNVWMALSFQGHVHHNIAREWFESLDDRDDARLCFCRITQLSFQRLITAEAVMGKDEVLSQRQAWDVYDRWFEDSRVFFLEEPANLEKMFRGISKQVRPAAKDWADSYLLAFAEAADLSVVTFDRTIRQKGRSVLLLQ